MRKHNPTISAAALFFAVVIVATSYPIFQAKGQNQQKNLRQRVLDLEELVQMQGEALSAIRAMLVCVDADSTASDLIFNGCNVHVRNGVGVTNSTNSYGNLIVGYNENPSSLLSRLGSRNVAVGANHAYDDTGGLVAGSPSTLIMVTDDQVIARSGAVVIEVDENDLRIESTKINIQASRTVDLKGASSVDVNGTVF